MRASVTDTTAILHHPSLVEALNASHELARLIVTGRIPVHALLAVLNRWPNALSARLRGVTRGQDATSIEVPLRHFLARFEPGPAEIADLVRHPSLVDALASSQELTRLIIDGNVHVSDLIATLDRWPAGIDDARGRDEALLDVYRMTWARMTRGAAHPGLLDAARASIGLSREPYLAARKVHALVMNEALDYPRFHQRLEHVLTSGPPREVDPRLTDAMAREPALMEALDQVLQRASCCHGAASLVGRDASPQRLARALQLLAKPGFLDAALRDTEHAALNYGMLMSAAYADETIDVVLDAPHPDGRAQRDACHIEATLRRVERGAERREWLPRDAPPTIVMDRIADLPGMAQRDRLNLLLQPGVLARLAMHCDQPFGTPTSAPLAYALDELRHALPQSANDATGEITTVEVMDALLPKPFGTTASVTDWICLSLDHPGNREAIEAYVSIVCRAAASAGKLFGTFLTSQFSEPLVFLPPSVTGRPPGIEDCFLDTEVCGDKAFAGWCRSELRAAGLITS